jgi:nucleoside diphosphate kinase
MMEDTLVIIKPDSFWRNLNHQVESRIKALGLKVVAEIWLAAARPVSRANFLLCSP